MRAGSAVLLALLGLACRSEPPTATDRPAPPRSVQPTSAPRPASAAAAATTLPHSANSNGGTYVVSWRTEPDPIALGELFRMHVRVARPAAPDTPLSGVQLLVDAVMPEHSHGMNTQPRVVPTADGTFRVEGLLLHMSGRWELHFDVNRGGITERAQADVHMD